MKNVIYFILFALITLFLFICYINGIHINRWVFMLVLISITCVVSHFAHKPKYSKKLKEIRKETNPKRRIEALLELKEKGVISEDSINYLKIMYKAYAEKLDFKLSLEWYAKYLAKSSITFKPKTKELLEEENSFSPEYFDDKIKDLKLRFENGDFKDTADYYFNLLDYYFINDNYEKALECTDKLYRLKMSNIYKMKRYIKMRIPMNDFINLGKVEVLISLNRIDEAERILSLLSDPFKKSYNYGMSLTMKLVRISIAKKNSSLAKNYLEKIIINYSKKWGFRTFYLWLYEMFLIEIQCNIIDGILTSVNSDLDYIISNSISPITSYKAKKLQNALSKSLM